MKKLSLVIMTLILFMILLIIYYGFSSIIFTSYILIYLIILLISFRRGKKLSNFRLAAVTTLASLLLIEIVLFKWGMHKTYLEENGSLIGRSSFFEDRMEELRCKYYKCCAWYKIAGINIEEYKSNNEFSYLHKYNSMGFRNPEISSKNTKKILCMGDSFTEGYGAPQDSTWPALLATLLNQDTEVINAGVGGSDVVYVQKILEDDFFGIQPEVVILALNASDLTELAYRRGTERFRPNCRLEFTDKGMLSYLYNNLYVARHIAHDLLKLNDQLISVKEESRRDKYVISILTETLVELNALCKKNDMVFIIVMHPFEFELGADLLWRDEVIKTADASGIRYLDLFELFEQKQKESNLFWKIDRHYNSDGYSLMADEIYNYMVSDSAMNQK